MTCGRAVVERAGELRRSGLSCREMARELDGPSKSAVARRTRAEGGTVGRAAAKMGLPKVVGDGPACPGIDPDDKDALMERLVPENAVLGAANGVLEAASLDGPSNGGKAPVIDRLGPCGKWPLREPTSSLGISRGPYGCQRRAIARPARRRRTSRGSPTSPSSDRPPAGRSARRPPGTASTPRSWRGGPASARTPRRPTRRPRTPAPG